jgi:hypothetical protein
MFNFLQKKILAFLFVATMATAALSASDDHNLTDTELHAFLGIITNFILSSNSVLLDVPTLTTNIPTETTDSNITVEVNAEAGTKVYVDGIEMGTVDENGTIEITILLNHGNNEIHITVKNGVGNESEALVLNIQSNEPPIANNNSITISEDTSLDINVTVNDSDVDGDSIVVISVTVSSHGTTSINTDGTIHYVADLNFNGTDSFEYTISDGYSGTDTATVMVTVNAMPDPITPILANQTAQVYTINTTINTLTFTNTGGAVTSCSVLPALPIGLQLSPSNDTCEITGTPTEVADEVYYTIVGSNSAGTDTATVMISVTPDLLINEISSAYYTNSDRWFEIYNPTAHNIDISDYTLKSRSYDGSTVGIFEFSFPSKIILAGDYLIIKPNHGPAFGSILADIENDQVMYLKDTVSNKYPLWFSDGNGFLEILKNGNTVDFVTIGFDYTPTTTSSWTGTNIPSFTTNSTEFWKSVARDINSSDTNTLNDWQVREFPTYAGLNDVTCNDDTDADGIPDCSEINGSTYTGMDLYAFGARVNQKDIFIEVDYMDSTNEGTLAVDEGVIPRQDALEKVKDSFLSNGYVVHFYVGDLYSQNGNTIDASMMDLGGGNEVAYSLVVNLGCTNFGINTREYKVDNMQVQRKQIFYYMLFGTSQNSDGSAGSSGCAESPGNDSLMTLGSWGLNTNTASSTNILVNFQAGTVMHEFGHNLGLGHGGNESKNYKPNYLSVMNYLYQLDGLATIGDNEGDRYYHNKGGGCPNSGLTNPYYGDPQNFKLDYSHGISTSLDEVNGIVEANGFGHVASVPVDYNCNGNAVETLTNFNVNPNYNNTNDTVSDHDDWSIINIIFARTYSGNSGISMNPSQNNKITINPLMNDIQPIAEEPPIKIPTHRSL